MKKLALIMLAVVSMALVSCGGGKKAGVEIASPAISYQNVNENDLFDSDKVNIKDCLSVKSVAIRENGSQVISVTAQVEMIKQPSKTCDYIIAKVELLDENGARICCYDEKPPHFKGLNSVGDVVAMSWEVSTFTMAQLAKDIIPNVKYVRIYDALGNHNLTPEEMLEHEKKVDEMMEMME